MLYFELYIYNITSFIAQLVGNLLLVLIEVRLYYVMFCSVSDIV